LLLPIAALGRDKAGLANFAYQEFTSSSGHFEQPNFPHRFSSLSACRLVFGISKDSLGGGPKPEKTATNLAFVSVFSSFFENRSQHSLRNLVF